MIAISNQKLDLFFKNIREKKIVILGDLMLDRYIEGTVHRISPEAPVPVVEVENEYQRLGGAANVVYNIRSLGAIPLPVGVVGADNAGNEIINQLNRLGVPVDYVISDADRPTVVKTRIIANGQHVVRADWESKKEIPRAIERRIKEIIASALKEAEALIIEDYNKGLLTKPLINDVIHIARQQSKIVTVDPKFDNFFEYKYSTVFKPNRKEVESALGIRIRNENKLQEACQKLSRKLNSDYILITLGEQGMCLFEKGGRFARVSTRARQVHDVSGAGDTVISTLTLGLIADFNITEAVTLANYAAGAVCAQVGVVPITREDLKKTIAFFRDNA